MPNLDRRGVLAASAAALELPACDGVGYAPLEPVARAAVGAVVLTPGPAQALRPPSPILPPPKPSPRPHLWQVWILSISGHQLDG